MIAMSVIALFMLATGLVMLCILTRRNDSENIESIASQEFRLQMRR